jgi:hypothetical protein
MHALSKAGAKLMDDILRHAVWLNRVKGQSYVRSQPGDALEQWVQGKRARLAITGQTGSGKVPAYVYAAGCLCAHCLVQLP